MLFDTDILIWVQRGNLKAARLIDSQGERMISVQTYMELLQGAHKKEHHEAVRGFLTEFGFQILPLSENIGHRASIYIEEYALAFGMCAGDALIAATATEHNLILSTANAKHFKPVRDLKLKVFKP